MIAADDNNSAIVEVEDALVFLNHLSYCLCITEKDAELISDVLNKLSEQYGISTNSASTKHNEDADTNPYLGLVF